MIDLYYWTTPNGHKITIFLEEAELPYRIVPVNISKGEQFKPEFLAISPNNRMPAIVDHDPKDGRAPVSVFEFGAILVYLAEKTGKYLPNGFRDRVEVMEWLFWQMGGLGPMAGQNHHFAHYAPEKIPYAIDRYVKETNRLYGVLNKRLADREFIAGRLFDRRHGDLSLDRAVRAAGPEARGVSRPQALVRGHARPSSGETRLCPGQGDQYRSRR